MANAVKEDTCANCEDEETEAVIYCADCTESLCHRCNVLRHHPGTNKERHSVETIVKSNRGPCILSPIIDEIMVMLIFWLCWHCLEIRQDYLYNYTICPLDRGKNYIVVSIDVVFYKLLDGALIPSFCSAEDLFWRHFLDLWVYGVMTSNDTVFHLVVSCAGSFVFKMVVLDNLGFVLGIVYGIVMQLWMSVEMLVIPPIPPFTTIAMLVMQYPIDVSAFFGGDDPCPPMTAHRRRPSINMVDGFLYIVNRQTRQIIHFSCIMTDILSNLTTYSILGVTLARLILIFMPVYVVNEVIPGILAALPVFGLGETIARHKEWFHHGEKGMLSGTIDAAIMMVIPSWLNCRFMCVVFLPLVCAGFFVIRRHLNKQTESFEQRWNEGLKHTVSDEECKCCCVTRTSKRFWSEDPGGRNDPARWVWWARMGMGTEASSPATASAKNSAATSPAAENSAPTSPATPKSPTTPVTTRSAATPPLRSQAATLTPRDGPPARSPAAGTIPTGSLARRGNLRSGAGVLGRV